MKSRILGSIGSIRVGFTLPDGEFSELDGSPVRLFDLIRRRTIITVVDLECGSCLEQIQLIVDRGRSEFGDADFLFISASPREALAELSGSLNKGTRFLYDRDGQWQTKLNIQVYPLTLAVDRSGIIVGMEVTNLSSEQIHDLITSDVQQSHSGPTDALQSN